MVLVVDNYDSFTYNLVDRLGALGAGAIAVVRNDEASVAALRARRPSCIVISPGPGGPGDAGISREVVRELGPSIPVLGVCLGHQAIAAAYGARVTRARRPRHGKTSPISHDGDPLFAGLPSPFAATRYHSLVVDPASLSRATGLVPIAYALDDGEVMALRHRDHPVWGVQFHPESIGTPAGARLLGNMLRLARG